MGAYLYQHLLQPVVANYDRYSNEFKNVLMRFAFLFLSFTLSSTILSFYVFSVAFVFACTYLAVHLLSFIGGVSF